MRERKKTAVHGTLGMTLIAWKFNSKQLLSKTLNSRINIIETRAVLNIVKQTENGLRRANGRVCNESKGVFRRNFQLQLTLYRET